MGIQRVREKERVKADRVVVRVQMDQDNLVGNHHKNLLLQCHFLGKENHRAHNSEYLCWRIHHRDDLNKNQMGRSD
jgi:hypothetical protein